MKNLWFTGSETEEQSGVILKIKYTYTGIGFDNITDYS
jgi:hypothetical protein